MSFQLKTGVVQSECSGEVVVPTEGGLVKGQAYYARVFAYSPVGFSQGQAAPGPAKPTTVPGRPTSVSIEVYDAQSLKAVFSPPADDGGDTGNYYPNSWRPLHLSAGNRPCSNICILITIDYIDNSVNKIYQYAPSCRGGDALMFPSPRPVLLFRGAAHRCQNEHEDRMIFPVSTRFVRSCHRGIYLCQMPF